MRNPFDALSYIVPYFGGKGDPKGDPDDDVVTEPPPPPVGNNLKYYSDPSKPPPFKPTEGKHWIRVKPYKIGLTEEGEVYGYWDEEDLPDEDKRLRTKISQDRLDFDKEKANLDRAIAEGKGKETIAIAQQRLEQAKATLDLSERKFQASIEIAQQKSLQAERKSALESRKFDASIDPTTGKKWQDIFTQQGLQDTRARQSWQDNAAFTDREQGIRKSQEEGFKTLDEKRKAFDEYRFQSFLRGNPLRSPDFEEGATGKVGTPDRPWWANMPGAGMLAARQRQDWQSQPKFASTPINPADTGTGGGVIPSQNRPIPFQPREPLPEYTPAFEGAEDPWTSAARREDMRTYNASATGAAQARMVWETSRELEDARLQMPGYLRRETRRSPFRQR